MLPVDQFAPIVHVKSLPRAILFVMNLYSSPQSTRLYVHAGIGRDLGEIQLDAMEVRVIEL